MIIYIYILSYYLIINIVIYYVLYDSLLKIIFVTWFSLEFWIDKKNVGLFFVWVISLFRLQINIKIYFLIIFQYTLLTKNNILIYITRHTSCNIGELYNTSLRGSDYCVYK
jgi:hypothetical protein